VAVDEFDTMFLEGGVEKNRLQKSAELFNLVRVGAVYWGTPFLQPILEL
jgi:hypothetical protein